VFDYFPHDRASDYVKDFGVDEVRSYRKRFSIQNFLAMKFTTQQNTFW